MAYEEFILIKYSIFTKKRKIHSSFSHDYVFYR